MGLSKPILEDLTTTFNSVYQLNRDVSGYDKLTIQIAGAVLGPGLYVYGTLDNGMPQGSSLPTGNYGASLAINYTPIQAINLATGSAVTQPIAAAGMYRVTASDQQFVRIQGAIAGTPTNVYRILLWESKIS